MMAVRFTIAFTLLLAAGTSHVQARPATCYNSDDGTYPCDFAPYGGNSSFTARGAGQEYTIDIYEPGYASGSVLIDGRVILLPGTFLRSRQDRACWVSDETDFALCVY